MSKAATADSYSKNMLHQKVFRTIICILFCIIALLPFVLLVMNATRDSESIKAGVSLIPSTHLIENWKNLMIKQNGMQITLQKAIINSATITIPGTFLSVYFSSLTAYGIHVYDFKFKKFAWAFIMAVMMVPSQISIIGFYRFMLDLKLIDTYVPLIIPTIAAPTVVFFMKQYMESTLSLEMIEAARIDGANGIQQFFKMTVPLLKPTILLTAIMSTSGTLQLFDESVNLTAGGPGKSTMTLAHYIYNISFVETPKFNYAAALSVFILVSVAILSAIQMKVGDKRD